MIVSIEGHTPDVSSAAFVADNATVCGDVKVGEDSSIWFGAVLRAECEPLRIGDRTNVQDNVVVAFILIMSVYIPVACLVVNLHVSHP